MHLQGHHDSHNYHWRRRIPRWHACRATPQPESSCNMWDMLHAAQSPEPRGLQQLSALTFLPSVHSHAGAASASSPAAAQAFSSSAGVADVSGTSAPGLRMLPSGRPHCRTPPLRLGAAQPASIGLRCLACMLDRYLGAHAGLRNECKTAGLDEHVRHASLLPCTSRPGNSTLMFTPPVLNNDLWHECAFFVNMSSQVSCHRPKPNLTCGHLQIGCNPAV